jgi:WD40 repeat protein
MKKQAILAISWFCIWLFLICLGARSYAQAVFPQPDALLQDTKHKEPKGGMSMHGNELVIQTGVGMPGVINVVAFSQDGSRLAAGKDFGRVVIFDLKSRTVSQVIDSGQGVVHAISLSPDNTLIATAGNGDKGASQSGNRPTERDSSRFTSDILTCSCWPFCRMTDCS